MASPELRSLAGEPSRCFWCSSEPIYQEYHDTEWGQPLYDDQRLFELLLLEGFQAGLSWITILKRREGMRAAFDGFVPTTLAAYTEADFARLKQDPRIIRNTLKIKAASTNAQAYLKLKDAGLTLSDYLWSFTEGKVLRGPYRRIKGEMPAKTALSDAISKDLKRRGFTFVGSTIAYAFMQAMGMVDDHDEGCFLYRER